MKISCTQENLNQGLSIVSHIANKNSNLPILSNILVKAQDKILTLSTTNLEIGVSTQVRGKIEEDGEVTIEARLLSDYISLLPKERVDLELDTENNLKISCQKNNTKIKGQSAIDFPLIPKLNKDQCFLIKAKDFKEAVASVSFAVSTSETRPEISGVFMSFKGKELILAATDSYRLAEKKVELVENTVAEEKKIIVPVKTLQEISRILGVFKEETSIEYAENLEICLTDNQIMFSYNNIELVSRLIEGQYPDYTQIIPTEFNSHVKFNISELSKAVKTTSLFTKSGIFDIKLELKAETKEMIITSSSSQSGENISSLDVDLNGQDAVINLNYRYLLDGLQNLKADNAVLDYNDGNSPCALKPENETNYIYLIMPIRQ